MLRGVSLCAVLALCTASAVGAQTSRVDDEREVLATVQRLFDAMRARDTATMGALFAPGARLVGMRTRQTGEVVMQELTASQFADFVARDTRAPWTRIDRRHVRT